MTFETRPDWCREVHIDRMLAWGGTKVELGVQSLYDDVLQGIERGHTVADSVEANRALRDSGFKVGFHMMPGLPGSDPARDLQMFKELFTDGRFCPDYLKIYPTLVVENTKLYDMWKRGEYTPLTSEVAAVLIAGIKEALPPWVRLQRIQRDIPVKHISGGVTKSNVRQLSGDILRESQKKCRCIRCREIGHKLLEGAVPDPATISLNELTMDVCGGKEHFLSFEDASIDALIGFLRLRFPGKPHRPELEGCSCHPGAARLRQNGAAGRPGRGLATPGLWQAADQHGPRRSPREQGMVRSLLSAVSVPGSTTGSSGTNATVHICPDAFNSVL